MLGSVRIGIVFGTMAVVAWLGSVLLASASGGIGLLVGLVASLALGWGAGYTAAKTTRAFGGAGRGRGFVAGSIGGIIVLLGSVVIAVVFASFLNQRLTVWLQRVPLIEELPLTTLINSIAAAALRTGGLLSGTCLGLLNCVLMGIGGAIGGASWRR